MDKGVVRIKFSNGAGNNIFQYIYARLLAEKHDCLLSHPALPVLDIKANKILLNKKLPTVEIKGSSKIKTNYHAVFNMNSNQNFDLNIYPEDFTLYRDKIDKIKAWFKYVPVTKYDDLVLHLRLGDRLVLKGCYENGNPTPVEEYIEGIKRFNFTRLHIVTDMQVWKPLRAGDIADLKFHHEVPREKRVHPQKSADYFNSLYEGLQQFKPIVRINNSVRSDFDYIRKFNKIIFQHGTLAWWAAALSDANLVSLYGRWRGGKEINLGWTDFDGWEQWGQKTAPPRSLKEWHLKNLAKQYDLKDFFVETGTANGQTLKALENQFDMLYSVEFDEKKYKKAISKFNKDKVKIFQGDSSKIIKEIVKYIKAPTLFWLDAHDGKNSTPILKELEIILTTNLAHVIIIDDLRYFETLDTYPSLDEIINLVKIMQPDAVLDAKFDSIRIFLKK